MGATGPQVDPAVPGPIVLEAAPQLQRHVSQCCRPDRWVGVTLSSNPSFQQRWLLARRGRARVEAKQGGDWGEASSAGWCSWRDSLQLFSFEFTF